MMISDPFRQTRRGGEDEGTRDGGRKGPEGGVRSRGLKTEGWGLGGDQGVEH